MIILHSRYEANHVQCWTSLKRIMFSVTSKKQPNVGDLGKLNCCQRLWKVTQSPINHPIWSYWSCFSIYFCTKIKGWPHRGVCDELIALQRHFSRLSVGTATLTTASTAPLFKRHKRIILLRCVLSCDVASSRMAYKFQIWYRITSNLTFTECLIHISWKYISFS